MSDPIAHAAGMAADLIRWECRGPGDLDNAMRRLARRIGVSHGVLWALRYRAPKDIYLSAYLRLRAAYAAERERQLERLAHDIDITQAEAGPDHAAVRAGLAVVDAARRAPVPPRQAEATAP